MTVARKSSTPVTVEQVCTRGERGCGLDSKGQLTCWEADYLAGELGLARLVEGSPAAELICGPHEVCARTPAGDVFCLDRAPSTRPVTLPGPARALRATETGLCAELTDGAEHCWVETRAVVEGEEGAMRCEATGAEIRCRLSHVTAPRRVDGLAAARALAISGRRACALEEGHVACWGTVLEHRYVVEHRGGLDRAALPFETDELSVQPEGSACVRRGRRAACLDADQASWRAPPAAAPWVVQLGGATSSDRVADDGICAITRRRTAVCATGRMRSTNTEYFTRSTSLGVEGSRWSAVSRVFRIADAIGDHVLALAADGTVHAFRFPIEPGPPIEVAVSGLEDSGPIRQISAEPLRQGVLACVTTRAGRVSCSHPDVGAALSFEEVEGLEGAVEAHAGRGFACARGADGAVRCWGGVPLDGWFGSALPVDRSREQAP